MGTKINKRIITSKQSGQLIGKLNNGIKQISTSKLEELQDVNITEPLENNDLLAYNGEKWQNSSLKEIFEENFVILDGGNAIDK